MPLRHHVTLPFERIGSELNLPMRGVIPAGTFVTVRPQPASGWDAAGLPVPLLTVRQARQLYNRGIIGPKPQAAQQSEMSDLTKKSRKR